METIELTVQQADAGQRLDRFLPAACGLSRAAAQQLIEGGHVRLGGQKPAKSHRLAAGEVLAVSIPPPRETALLPQDIPLDILYEDEHLLVVDKPKGMVVHPAAGNPDGTLVNALLHHCGASLSGIGGERRPGIVHRIDKDTSGLLVVAKNDASHRHLAAQFAAHSIRRVYSAVVYGHFGQPAGEIDAPIGRSRADRKKMAVTSRGAKPACTHYEVLGEYPGFSLLRLRLQTGRTHQIRVHMAEMGHPVAGDPVYGPKKVMRELRGQCLHAGVLGFVHPATGESMEFSSPPPPEFAAFLAKLAGGAQNDADVKELLHAE